MLSRKATVLSSLFWSLALVALLPLCGLCIGKIQPCMSAWKSCWKNGTRRWKACWLKPSVIAARVREWRWMRDYKRTKRRMNLIRVDLEIGILQSLRG